MNTRKRGFTLVELLVVAAVVGVLASLLFPALPMARQDARSASSTSESSLLQRTTITT
ncbi:MAG: prepilin-type N-terminal cleavage/methylation domain-containing protein [Thermoguttaceae bacterium]|nr:prepilin-type N-terminal cleavage/methylation domain-containing protein [Thermoguttaceae bacterium]